MKKSSILSFLVLASLFIATSCQKAAQNKAQQAEYNVYAFGAIGDGITNDQKAIQKAIDACFPDGGIVVLEKGVFLTGQLNLVSNMTLFIDTSATLLGIQSDSETDYPHHLIETVYPNRMNDDCQRRLIYGNHVRNVTIKGGGKILGQGDYAPWVDLSEFGMDMMGTEKDRPSILAFVGSKNITVSDISLEKPACWTQVYIETDSITLRGLKVNTGHLQPNRDGIDIVDCHHVLIEECEIMSEDDGICFKSGSEYGCKDVIVRNCKIDKLNIPAGNCFKLGTDGLGSFMNFDVSNLTLLNAEKNTAIVVESMDGAIIDNLSFRNCSISGCGQAFFVMLADRKRTVPGRKGRIGSISNIHFSDITGDHFTKQYASIISGMKGHNIQNISFENVNLELKGGIKTSNQQVPEYDGSYPEGSKFGLTSASAFFIRHTDQVAFRNCTFTYEKEDARKALMINVVTSLTVE